MKKTIITLIVAALLIPLTGLAITQCPEGYHWDGTQDTTEQGDCITYSQVWHEGWTEQGQCNSWADPVCGSYHWGWNNGQFTWHRHCQDPVCNGYEQIIHEGYYTQGECSGYEQIVIEGVGVCDYDHEGSPNYKAKGTSQGVGAVNWYVMLPQIVYANSYVWTGSWLNWVQVGWLTSQFSTSRVVYGEVSQPFALSQFGYPYYGGNVLVNDRNTMNGSYYGYQFSTIEDIGMATWHNVYIPSSALKPNTKYYYRTISHELGRDEFVSQEGSFSTY